MKTVQFNDKGEWYGHINKYSEAMQKQADQEGAKVEHTFNEVPIFAVPGETASEPAARCMKEMERRRQEYLKSPECKRREEEARRRQKEQDAALEDALAAAPGEMSFSDKGAWEEGLEKNQDGYGGAVYRYAETWARLMEGRLVQGETVEHCAKKMSHLADNEGITGFMYGAAVSILAHCWIHGENLRLWHNLDTQIGSEGEKANESGGCLNPALLNIEA
jgi:hypothetical protein